MSKAIGILGVGTYLPPEVRTNSWWSENVARAWKEKAERRVERIRQEFERESSDVAKTTLEHVLAVGDDAFHGARERRVIPREMKSWDMETAAAREAIDRSGVPKSDIDLVLSYSMIPDFINVPSACVVHSNLGLKSRCTTMAVDAVCNSFMMQLTLAQSMIANGQARYALLTQASALTRLPASGEPIDVSGGDGASALVIGPVTEGRGILAASHHTDGSLWGALVCGAPDKHWTEDRCTAYSVDRDANLNMFTRMTARAKQVIGEALLDAGVSAEEVAFFACHQPFPWLPAASKACTGMTKANVVNHFNYTGTLSAVNLPLQLAVGEKEGLLKPGDVVACFQGGTGMTWSGMALRWGD